MEHNEPIANGLLIADLIVLYINGKLTEEQLSALKSWIDAKPENQLLFEQLIREESLENTHLQFLKYNSITAFTKVQDAYAARQPKKLVAWPRYFAAASVIFCLCIIGYWLLKPTTPEVLANAEDLLPVKHGVVLAVQGGGEVLLDKQQRGHLACINNAEADYGDHSLTYSKPDGSDVPVMHTLINNSSEKFDLELADGTEVSLDIASSITYPTYFAGQKRQVKITGQAYLKVKHDVKPFNVQVNDEIIEDLGTAFNINAYPDNGADKITLLEGSVKILSQQAAKSLILKPGEQVIVNTDRLTINNNADIEAETAWLQNKIIIHRQSLETVLKEVARIYDVQVVWTDINLKKIECGGAISRNRKLADILNFMRKTGQVDFNVQGKTVKVIKPNR
ncbi:MAG: DUF4974 domain-containing protein [Mucilaginibacter sp.]|nr:DUF4974 domain-containing protein [Mucilaginibacter sp.]